MSNQEIKQITPFIWCASCGVRTDQEAIKKLGKWLHYRCGCGQTNKVLINTRKEKDRERQNTARTSI